MKENYDKDVCIFIEKKKEIYCFDNSKKKN